MPLTTSVSGSVPPLPHFVTCCVSDAHRHVNKMCMAAGIPLVESGTAGYLGQVQPSAQAPKLLPVCTIRSTPSQPIHCIVWAKSYLLPQLFGEDEDGSTELDAAEKQGENDPHLSLYGSSRRLT
ncbi:hypothetical protein L210DRAFT_3507511 [Boletus edulis BED1]|uniref:Uncharacterized protein n=1 Tax=Boletus edulis BED1 TaxID=1328754 RepID=A0AAD4BK14_BOLED|nr:hypothetical protein L210DRAFT_3507511 [Boletus edulis BED1]